MKARFRSKGIGGLIAVLLATGALLVPAASAQAQASPGSCEMLASVIRLSFANGQWGYGLSLLNRGNLYQCW